MNQTGMLVVSLSGVNFGFLVSLRVFRAVKVLFRVAGADPGFKHGGFEKLSAAGGPFRGSGGMFPREIMTVRSSKRDFFIFLISLNETSKHR